MKKSLFFIFLLFLTSNLFAQKYLSVDKYRAKRIKYEEGDVIVFKLKGQEQVFTDHIRQLNDTSLVLASNKLEVPLSEFSQFKHKRKWVPAIRTITIFFGGGFLISAAVHPLVSNAQYDPVVSAITGAALIGVNQGLRIFTWKKYNFEKDSRIQIINLNMR